MTDIYYSYSHKGGAYQETVNIDVGGNDQNSSFSVKSCLLYLVFYPTLSYLVLSYIVLICPASSCVTESVTGARCCCVDSQCHSAQWEDKDSIEEAGMEQGAAQDTLTDGPVFVPSPPFIHTTNTVFSFSPLPALSCLALFLSLPFHIPPLLLYFV